MDALMIFVYIFPFVLIGSLSFFIYVTEEKDKERDRNNDDTEELKELAEKYKAIKDNDEWWKPCPICEFFDGYDMCLLKKNFGSVSDISKARCEKNNLFKEKQQ